MLFRFRMNLVLASFLGGFLWKVIQVSQEKRLTAETDALEQRRKMLSIREAASEILTAQPVYDWYLVLKQINLHKAEKHLFKEKEKFSEKVPDLL